MDDNFLDDDFDWEDGVIIGGFFDYMTEQEEEDERLRRKLEREMSNGDDSDRDYEEDCLQAIDLLANRRGTQWVPCFLPLLFGQMLRLIDSFFHSMASQKADPCQKKSFVIAFVGNFITVR